MRRCPNPNSLTNPGIIIPELTPRFCDCEISVTLCLKLYYTHLAAALRGYIILHYPHCTGPGHGGPAPVLLGARNVSSAELKHRKQ